MALFMLLLTVFIMPIPSSAASLEGDSRTYVLYRETAAKEKVLGGYEYLNFAVQDLGSDSISFHTGGWLRYDLKGDLPGSKSANDIQYAYLSVRGQNNNAVLNLGRVMVFEGVAAERVDGAYARTDLKGGFALSAFGGVPVLTNEGDDSGTNSIYGARIAHRMDDLYTVGLSYLKQQKNSLDFREEGGIDLWFRPFNKVELMGKSTYDAITKRWMQDNVNLLLGPFANLRFDTEFSWIDYQSYFAATTNSAFLLQPGGFLDPLEQLTVLGETVSYEAGDNLSCSVDYKKYGYSIAGSASYYGAGFRYGAPRSMTAGVSVHRMDGETDRLNYDEYRAYAFKKLGHYDLTVDLLDVKYKEAVNGVSSAYSATLAAGYEVSERLLLGADVEYAKNPDFDKDVRMFVKMVYNFDVAGGTRTSTVHEEKHERAPEPVAPAPAAVPAPEMSAPQPEPVAPAPDMSAPQPEPVAPAPADQTGTPEGTTPSEQKEGKE